MFKKGVGGALVRGYVRREYPSPTLSLLKNLKEVKDLFTYLNGPLYTCLDSF